MFGSKFMMVFNEVEVQGLSFKTLCQPWTRGMQPSLVCVTWVTSVSSASPFSYLLDSFLV